MRSEKLIDAIGEVKDSLIDDANTKTAGKKNAWIKWAALAAAACICVIVGVLLIPDSKPEQTSVGGVLRTYRNVTVTGAEEAIEWPWEYKTVYERFPKLVFDGKEYTTKTFGMSLSAAWLGEKLGVGDGVGYDIYSEQEHHQSFDVWKINGIDADLMIAAEMEGQFYTFQLEKYDPPATLGEVLDGYSLPQALALRRFSVYEDGKEPGYYALTDDGSIWQTLAECRDAQFVEDDAGGYVGKDRIAFTATSEALGVYKRVFYISTDGYLSTNVFDWAYSFFIGEKAASEILSFAKKNAQKVEQEPYLYSLAGTLTEIGEGYVLVDDSVLCADEKDGMVFKVLTTDLRVSRCIDFQKIGVGSVVVVSFTEPVHASAGYVVDGAVSLVKGSLNDGAVTVAE